MNFYLKLFLLYLCLPEIAVIFYLIGYVYIIVAAESTNHLQKDLATIVTNCKFVSLASKIVHLSRQLLCMIVTQASNSKYH